MKGGAWLVLAFVAFLLLAGLFGAALAAEIPREAERYRRDLIREARAVWGLDAPVTTFAAQIEQESLYRPDVTSHAGAQGMGQIMPATGQWLAQQFPELGPAAPFNPRWAIRALVRYNRWHWERLTGGNDCHRLAKSIASYNQGLGWTRRQERAAPEQARPWWFDGIENTNPGKAAWAFSETRDYVRRIVLERERKYFAARWSDSPCWRWP